MPLRTLCNINIVTACAPHTRSPCLGWAGGAVPGPGPEPGYWRGTASLLRVWVSLAESSGSVRTRLPPRSTVFSLRFSLRPRPGGGRSEAASGRGDRRWWLPPPSSSPRFAMFVLSGVKHRYSQAFNAMKTWADTGDVRGGGMLEYRVPSSGAGAALWAEPSRAGRRGPR